MKKLMFAIAVIAMAIGAQAATVDWSYEITGATTKTAYGSSVSAIGDATTLTAYLFDAATWEGLGGTVTAADLSSKSLDSSAVKYQAAVGRGASQTHSFATADATDAIGAKRAVSDASWGATHDFYVVLVDNSKNPAEFTATSQTLTTRGPTDSPNTTGAFASTQTALSGATWGKVSSVPEPTSGILMLVGLGALALRRRRA